MGSAAVVINPYQFTLMNKHSIKMVMVLLIQKALKT